MRRALSLLGLVTFAVYAALIWVGLTRLAPEAGGLPAFDLRVTGYGAAEARAYLDALTEAGRQAYLGPVRVLDTLFPPLLGLLLAGLVWACGRPWLAALPFLYTAADLWENARVAAMLRSGDATLAPGASNLTQGKYALLALALAVLWLAWRGRRKA